MNVEKFDAQITNRVEEDVAVALQKFRQSVVAALKELLVLDYATYDTILAPSSVQAFRPVSVQCLVALFDPSKNTAGKTMWPRRIWTCREDALRKQIFAQLDVVARTMAARGIGQPDDVADAPNDPD